MSVRMIRYAGNWKDIMKRQEDAKKLAASEIYDEEEEEEDEEEEEEEEEKISQTFPDVSQASVVRQTTEDLTCGMRCLQNLYGKHIVCREDMDEQSKDLETKSFGVQMFDESLGYYHIEVLKAVLMSKGKYVQRVDLHKIPSEYFEPTLCMNPTFNGFVVAVGDETMKHYVAVRHLKGVYRKIDSLPGVHPVDVAPETLFKLNGTNYNICPGDHTPVVAVLAVGGSPFVEYQLLHDTWSDKSPSLRRTLQGIRFVTHPTRIVMRKRAKAAGVLHWYDEWKHKRVQPGEKTMTFLAQQLVENISDEKSIVLKMDHQQTIVRCANIEDIVRELTHMGWIDREHEFYLKQNGRFIMDEDQNEVDHYSMGPLEDFSVVSTAHIEVLSESQPSQQVQVGGFYKFRCNVEGTCIGHQHNAYSVRDGDGKVHVVYKKSIEEVTKR